ncbi:MAG: aspartate--tRNA(Asn) ligase [Clostridia bacterium]|nr:aspartate--tRNA(Asn) ligase [Clostridia bacterium]MBQ8845494.1 aspartate--tRNA(Asn) ligase [Clostridia bacterium]
MREYTKTKIKDVQIGKSEVWGWIEKVRDQKSMVFVVIKDRTGKIQVTIDKEQQSEIAEVFLGLTTDSYVTVRGEVVESPYVKLGGKELLPREVIVQSRAEISPIDGKSAIDQRLDYRYIDLRDEKKRAIFEVQTVIMDGVREFIRQEDFIEVHSPIMTSGGSESGANVFEVKYFDQKAYLIQSPQFYKQMAIASGFEKVFICTPVARAEKSFTKKHATEFISLDFEIADVESEEDVMAFEERLIHHTIKYLKERMDEKIKADFGVELKVPSLPFPRLTMKEVYKILEEECDYPIDEGTDLDTESEKLLAEYVEKTYGCDFFFIHKYPSEFRPFYTMKEDDDPTYSKSYDLYFKDIEITSGAQREHRPDILASQIAEKGIDPKLMEKSYIDFFKFGCPPHGGFAIGFERLTMLLLDLPTIKEVQFVFRGPDRLRP